MPPVPFAIERQKNKSIDSPRVLFYTFSLIMTDIRKARREGGDFVVREKQGKQGIGDSRRRKL